MCLNSAATLLLPLPERRDPNESVSHIPFSVSLQLSCKYWLDPASESEEEVEKKEIFGISRMFWLIFENFSLCVALNLSRGKVSARKTKEGSRVCFKVGKSYSLEFSSLILTVILLSFSDSSCDSASFGFPPSFSCFFWIFFTFARWFWNQTFSDEKQQSEV